MQYKALVRERLQFAVVHTAEERFLTTEEQCKLHLGFTKEGYLHVQQEDSTDYLILQFTGELDNENVALLEGDIVECGYMNEFGSTSIVHGVIRFAPETGSFEVDVFNDVLAGQYAEMTYCKRLDNTFTNRQLTHELFAKKKEKKADQQRA